MDKLKELLERVGLKTDQVHQLLNNDSAVDLKEVWGDVQAHYKTLLQNDSDFFAPIISRIKREERHKIEKFAMDLYGLDTQELEKKAVDGNPLTTEKIIEIGSDRLRETLKSQYKDATDTTLMKQIEDLESILKKEKKEKEYIKEVEIPEIRRQAKADIEQNSLWIDLERTIEKKPDLVVKPSIAFAAVKDELYKHGYQIQRKSNNRIDIVTRDGNVPMNEDKSKVIDLEAFMHKVFDEGNLLRKSNSNANANSSSYRYQQQSGYGNIGQQSTSEVTAESATKFSTATNTQENRGLLGLTKARQKLSEG